MECKLTAAAAATEAEVELEAVADAAPPAQGKRAAIRHATRSAAPNSMSSIDRPKAAQGEEHGPSTPGSAEAVARIPAEISPQCV